MRARSISAALASAVLLLCSACTVPTYDYGAYRVHMPRSILVLPPLNESTEVKASYSYLSTITMPLAEAGYYVFPVAVIDAYMKDNGLPTPGEMHTVQPGKFAKVLGADAVLYVTIEDWGQKYMIISSTTVVKARARLVDTRTGITLWEGRMSLAESSGGNYLIDNIIIAVAEQIIDTTNDQARVLSRSGNMVMIYNPNTGLLFGHYSPRYESDNRGL